MGSVENQNPWGPYENYRDCSQEICSIYCPQFCYLIFPPPPPLDEDSGTPLSPLVIAVIGVLASAFLLVGYYTIVTRFCWRRRRRNGQSPRTDNREGEVAETGRDQWPVVSAGLDESVIKTITVCKYQKGDGLIEGTDCAVCLSEFQENESLRLLPNCSHAFHPPCIDTWLKSQSTCPLCRANVEAFGNQTRPPPPAPLTPSTLNVNSFEFRRPDDLIHVVDDQARACQQGIAIGTGTDDVNGAGQGRSSVCLGAFSPQRRLLISDVLVFEEINEYVQG